MKEKNKNVFIRSAISPEFIANAIAKHQLKTQIGAHDIFLGQVRADMIEGKIVMGIDYSAHEEMANRIFHEIRETAFTNFKLSCMHIYHSLGLVPTGAIGLFIMLSSAHRSGLFEAIPFIVEEIKIKVPIFGKEIFEDQTHQWKINH